MDADLTNSCLSSDLKQCYKIVYCMVVSKKKKKKNYIEPPS